MTDTTGNRRFAFFFPHNTKTGFWWQGENARVASLAATARMAAPYFKTKDPKFSEELEKYAWNQLNWILGLNPYDVCWMNTGIKIRNITFWEPSNIRLNRAGL